MTVPDDPSFMRPLLEVTSDRQDWRTGDAKDAVADHVGITEDDRTELLASGKQLAYANRIGGAKTYLTKAGLHESLKRGWVRIADRRLNVLSSGEAINNAFLQ